MAGLRFFATTEQIDVSSRNERAGHLTVAMVRDPRKNPFSKAFCLTALP